MVIWKKSSWEILKYIAISKYKILNSTNMLNNNKIKLLLNQYLIMNPELKDQVSNMVSLLNNLSESKLTPY